MSSIVAACISLNSSVVKGTQPRWIWVYKEPHLQKKSDECAALWREWFELYSNKDPKAKELRKVWCQCADELGEMVHQEIKTNPRYKDVELFPAKKKPPR